MVGLLVGGSRPSWEGELEPRSVWWCFGFPDLELLGPVRLPALASDAGWNAAQHISCEVNWLRITSSLAPDHKFTTLCSGWQKEPRLVARAKGGREWQAVGLLSSKASSLMTPLLYIVFSDSLAWRRG